MQPPIQQIIEEIKAKKVFRRNRKRVELKILSALLYFYGLSLRKASRLISIFQKISHESIRIYYHRLKRILKPPEKKERRLIAIDETKLKLENRHIFVWSAVDVDTKECLTVWATEGRSSFHAYAFLKEVPRYCENKPEVVVDRGPWYLWALKRMGLKYRHKTFGCKNAVEGFFSLMKSRTKRFWNRFPFRSSFDSVQSWLESFVGLYNLERWLFLATFPAIFIRGVCTGKLFISSTYLVFSMKVSVIVATYSLSMFEHFKECVESIHNQTYHDVEIICIVDGDRDYFQIIKREMPDLRLYLNEKNLGLLLSRNRGVELAEGDIVAFIDDDAVADKRWIEELVRMYEEHNAIAAGGKIEPLWIVEIPKWLPEEFYWMIGVTHLGFPEEITEVRNTFGSNLSFRRDVFLELGGFNPEMGGIKGKRMLQGGETELCGRMRKKYRKGVAYNPNAIVYHKIFEKRVKFDFLVKRAFWQGYSKAVMERVVGEIEDERSYLKYVLKERLIARVKNALSGRSEEIQKLVSMLLFASLVGCGYIWGKLKL